MKCVSAIFFSGVWRISDIDCPTFLIWLYSGDFPCSGTSLDFFDSVLSGITWGVTWGVLVGYLWGVAGVLCRP